MAYQVTNYSFGDVVITKTWDRGIVIYINFPSSISIFTMYHYQLITI